MSEYQYVEFRAVDRPLDDKQLAFAEEQSSHAEVSRWNLNVEYNYGSFRGDVDGLLRGGFDLYLEYSNYGTRVIKMRLPQGLPFPDKLLERYFRADALEWAKDSKGTGGILSLRPFLEEMDYDNDFDVYLDAATRIREHLMQGDLRALYLLWLCVCGDGNADPDDLVEPPVPHGLADLPTKCAELLPFFGESHLFLQAAAKGIEAGPSLTSSNELATAFIDAMTGDRASAIVRRLMIEDPSRVKSDLIAEIREPSTSSNWPCTDLKRSLDELNQVCDRLIEEHNSKQKKATEAKAKRDAGKAEEKRQLRIEEMRMDPEKWLKESERLATAGGTSNYAAAADILADLEEAIGGEEGQKITRKHAAHLVKKHPTLNMLKSSLRKRDLLS